jgi:hypothetical protein
MITMKPVTPQTGQTPLTQTRKVVFGGSLMEPKTNSSSYGIVFFLAMILLCFSISSSISAQEIRNDRFIR